MDTYRVHGFYDKRAGRRTDTQSVSVKVLAHNEQEARMKAVKRLKESHKNYKPSKVERLEEQVLGFASIGRLQRLAGIHSNIPVYDQVDESDEELEEDEFSYAAAKAALAGKKEFKLNGSTHPVKMSKEQARKIIGDEDLDEGEELSTKGSGPSNPGHSKNGGEPGDSRKQVTHKVNDKDGVYEDEEYYDLDDPYDPGDEIAMGDEGGNPGDIGSEPVEEPFDTGDVVDPELDDEDMVDDTYGLDDMGPDAEPDGMVAMDTLPPVEPVDVPMDMDMGPEAEVVGDVRAEMENKLNDLLAQAPNLKIADFRDVLNHAEDVVSQIRAMGSQYLKEGSVNRRNANKTLREAAYESRSGFKKALFQSHSQLNEKKKNNNQITKKSLSGRKGVRK